MLERIAGLTRAYVGIVERHDFGNVHYGRLGYVDCSVALAIETWQGAFYLRISVTHSRGPSFRRTRVVKWAYSDKGLLDLVLLIQDFERLASAPRKDQDAKNGAPSGFLDRLIGRRRIATHEMQSPIEVEPRIRVQAQVDVIRGQEQLTILARSGAGESIIGQMPHAAVGPILGALRSVG